MKTENIIEILLKIEQEKPLLFSIDVLNLSLRFHHTLLRNGINTIADLVRNWKAIPEFTNMGIKGIQEITDKLNLWYQLDGHLSLSDAPDLPLNEKSVEGWTFTPEDTLLNAPISSLELPIRAYNVLKRNDIETVGQIIAKWQTVVSLYNVGPLTLEQIQKAIAPFQNRISNQKNVGNDALLNTDSLDVAVNESLLVQSNMSFIKVNVRELDLPLRAKLLLRDNDIRTIDQITSTKLTEIGLAEDANLNTIRQINTAILDWLCQDGNRKRAYLEVMKGKGIIARSEERSLDDYFNALFGLLNPRYCPIIEFRYGLKNGVKSTLEETAKQFGVTRARIQQIESMAIEIIKKHLYQIGQIPLFAKIKENIDTRGGFVSEIRLIDELQREFMDSTYSIKGIVEFVNKIFDGQVSLNQGDIKIVYLLTLNGWSTNSYNKDQILHTADKILEILSAVKLPLQWMELFSALIREDGLLTLDENLAHAVALCLSDTQQIQRQTDGGWLKFEKTTRYSRIISVMKQMGRPAHFSEITELYNQTYTDLPRSEHNIHSVLSGRDEFVRVGQGKYGLPEWGLHDDGNVANAVCRILANHEHPMSLADITDEVLKTWEVQNSAVLSSIENDARFSKTEDGNIWLTESGLTLKKKIKRDDDARWDRLLIVLRRLEKPSSVYLIVEAHNSSYPDRPLTVSAVKSMMYRKPELFIRTGRDEFGLAEWGLQPFQDAPVNRSEEILKILRQKSLIHIKELHNLYNEYHPEKQVSLVTIGVDLRNLAGTVSSPRRGIYKIIDEAEIEITPSQQDRRIEKILKIFIEMNRPPQLSLILERYNQLNPADAMTLESFMEYLMYVKSHPEKYSALFEEQQSAS